MLFGAERAAARVVERAERSGGNVSNLKRTNWAASTGARLIRPTARMKTQRRPDRRFRRKITGVGACRGCDVGGRHDACATRAAREQPWHVDGHSGRDGCGAAIGFQREARWCADWRRRWFRHWHRRDDSGRQVSAEGGARRYQEHLRCRYSAEQRTIKQVVQIAQSQFGGQIAVACDPERPSTRDAVFGGDRQKMPLSATTPYAGAWWNRRQALPTGQLPGWSGSCLRFEHSDARRHRHRNLSHARWPEHGRWQRRDLPLAEYQRERPANFMTGQFVTPQFVTDQAMRRSIPATGARSSRPTCSYPD